MSPSEASDLFRAPPDRWVDVGNGHVALRSVGEGPDVLFVHGWPVSGATFRSLLPHLAPHVRCHVVDLVGAGDSRFDRSVRLDVSEHAAAVRVVVDVLDVDTIALVAHDSGGLIARHALADDARVRAWGLVDTEQPQGASRRFRSFLQVRRLPRFEHLLSIVLNQPTLRRARLVLGDAFTDRALLDGEFTEFFLAPLATDSDRLWAAGELLRSFDLAALDNLGDLHARMNAPVRLVWGSDDPFFPLEWTRDMLGGFGGPAALHVIEGGKLFVHEEYPRQTAEALLPTLVARA
jgi:pimeloyl-ACP methyl ester carboxylesterase